MDNHKLIVPLKAGETEINYYVKNEEIYDNDEKIAEKIKKYNI
jgi:hypothetical protein